MRRALVLLVFSCLTAAALFGCKPAGEKKTERRQGPPEQYIRATLGAGENAKGTLGVISIQKAVEMFQLQNGRFPSSLDELQKEGFMPQAPTAPVGKKFAYDPATGKVSVVKK